MGFSLDDYSVGSDGTPDAGQFEMPVGSTRIMQGMCQLFNFLKNNTF
jgi:hypothetical protein